MDKVNPTWVQDNVDSNEDSNCSKGFKQRDLRHLLNTKKKGKRIEVDLKAKHDVLNSERTFEQQQSEANLIELGRCNAMFTRALAFKEEFYEKVCWGHAPPDLYQHEASSDDNDMIYSTPDLQEIKSAVFAINKGSVAGAVGFTSLFYQHCWDIIHEDLIAAIQEFFTGSPISRSFTASTLIPLPKVDDPVYWNNFRPISLCNVVNKIKYKILCTRLASIIPPMISKTQRGFIKGQSIADNILLATEMVHDLNSRQKAHSLIMKLDMEKAYDRVN
ncbi:uncharacterized protein LOC127248848 [Andrographis paniculata]|uniref:uncharacterized protein LOC127248848 n=1 Tax=Andrographis paniculata TaxID=175694 RepID=UPI0021E7C890|nr:uncharacterized protein LOC127248848 [Andrographis paniculata]